MKDYLKTFLVFVVCTIILGKTIVTGWRKIIDIKLGYEEKVYTEMLEFISQTEKEEEEEKSVKIQNKNKVEKLIYEKMKLREEETLIDLKYPCSEVISAIVQTKEKEYKIIFDTEKIKGQKNFYEPIRIKKIVQIR